MRHQDMRWSPRNPTQTPVKAKGQIGNVRFLAGILDVPKGRIRTQIEILEKQGSHGQKKDGEQDSHGQKEVLGVQRRPHDVAR